MGALLEKPRADADDDGEMLAPQTTDDRAARLDAALRLSDTLFGAVLRAMPEGFLLVDPDGAILLCNPQAALVLGVPLESLAGADALALCRPAVTEDGAALPDAQHPLARALGHGEAVEGLIVGVDRPDGVPRWVRISATPLRDGGAGLPYAAFCTLTDVTERRVAEKARARRAALVDSSEVAVIGLTRDGTVVSWNAGAERLYGLTAGEVVGGSVSRLVLPAEREFLAPCLQAVLRGEQREPVETTYGRADGQHVRVCLTFSPVRGEAGEVVGVSAIGRDITAQTRAEEALRRSEARLAEAQQVAQIGSWEFDIATGRFTWSAQMFRLMGIDSAQGEPTYEGLLRRYHPDDAPAQMDALQQMIRDGRPYECDFRVLGPDGDVRWMHTVGRGERDGTGTVIRLFGTVLDIAERKQAEQRIQEYNVVLEFQKAELEAMNAELEARATTDGLTGLKNHRAFQERLAAEVALSERHDAPLSLLLLDVDHFKQYNDAFGHPAGDDVLRRVARLMEGEARASDLAARHGGEEFALILPQTDGAGAAAIAERLRRSVAGDAGPRRPVTVSLGVATLTPGEDGGGLLARADGALYEAKAAGRNRVTRAGAGAGCAILSHAHPRRAV